MVVVVVVAVAVAEIEVEVEVVVEVVVVEEVVVVVEEVVVAVGIRSELVVVGYVLFGFDPKAVPVVHELLYALQHTISLSPSCLGPTQV